MSSSPAEMRSTRRRLLGVSLSAWLVVGLSVLVLGSGAAAWLVLRPAQPAPPLPAEVGDPEVQAALEAARQKVLARPRSAEAWGDFGMVLLAHLFDREADRCFTQASRLDATDPRWPYARGLLALRRDPDNAVPLLRRAADAARTWPDYRSVVRMELAETLQERGETAEAEALFREEYQANPDNARAALGLGLALAQRGEAREAERLLHAAAGSPLARKKATVQLAALARSRGSSDAGRYDSESAALPDDPAWPDPLLDASMALRVGSRRREREVRELERTHQYREAAALYQEQLRDRPTATAYAGAGLNLFRLGDYPAAVALLRQGVEREPDSAHLQFTLAQVQFTQAARHWNRAPGCPEAREGFAAVLEPARRATELKQDHSQAYLFWGLALTYLGRPREALVPLRQGVACRPEDFELQLALGEALLEVGQAGEARTHLENARRLDPKDPRPTRALARSGKKNSGPGEGP